MASPGPAASFAAQQVKFLRKTLRLNLERLADAAGLSMVMVERAESGRHKIDEQALRAIAKATGVEPDFFVEPTTEEAERSQAETKRALRQVDMIVLTRLRSAADAMRLFEERRDYQLETPTPLPAAASKIAEKLILLVREFDDVWSDRSATERLADANRVVALCDQLAVDKFSCWAGDCRRRGGAGRIGLISVRSDQSASNVRFAQIMQSDERIEATAAS